MINEKCRRILVVGAGEAGRMVAAEIECHGELNGEVIGFLDDDPDLAGKKVASIPVLGNTGELEEVVSSYSIDEIIIAIPTAPGRFVRSMIKRCRRAEVPYKILPGVMEIIKGAVHIDQIREVRVEDLLGRETVGFDPRSSSDTFSDRTILVTGAGGSIGSELCRQLVKTGCSRLILLGRGENRIFDIEEELGATGKTPRIDTVIDNLRNPARVMRIVREFSPDIIYHAAAHKHVHYMERDPEEAVLNNIGGSINLIEAAENCGVKRFVFISTDKAADPRGVMGATKRLVELNIRSRSGKSGCRFMTVRFGNVIGSTGSVVPLFLRQIARGGPVTVSDPEATRYFMTVKEAALLVMRASVIGKGGETFILDMGEPIKILEMARDIIMLTGHEPDTEIPVIFSGLRDGEKLHEVLVSSDESLESPGEEKILLARPSAAVPPDIEKLTGEMIEAAVAGDRLGVLGIMARLLPGFEISPES